MNVKSLTVWRPAVLVVSMLGLAAPYAIAQPDAGADLLVETSGPIEAAADSDVTYTVTVTNLGPDGAGDVSLRYTPPGKMTFVAAIFDSGFSCATPDIGSPGTTTCTATTLEAEASARFMFVVHIPGGTPLGTPFVNVVTAIATPPDTDPNEENNSGTVTTSTPAPPQADMALDKTGPPGAEPDADVVYTIRVVNTGPDPASNVTVSDPLPLAMTFVSLAQRGKAMSCATPPLGSGGEVTCTAASYPVGTTTLTLTARTPPGVSIGTIYPNVVTVRTTAVDPNSENDKSTTDLEIGRVIEATTAVRQAPRAGTLGAMLAWPSWLSPSGGDGRRTDAHLLISTKSELP